MFRGIGVGWTLCFVWVLFTYRFELGFYVGTVFSGILYEGCLLRVYLLGFD